MVVIVTLFTPVYDADNNMLKYPITVVPDQGSRKESIVAWCAPPSTRPYELYRIRPPSPSSHHNKLQFLWCAISILVSGIKPPKGGWPARPDVCDPAERAWLA